MTDHDTVRELERVRDELLTVVDKGGDVDTVIERIKDGIDTRIETLEDGGGESSSSSEKVGNPQVGGEPPKLNKECNMCGEQIRQRHYFIEVLHGEKTYLHPECIEGDWHRD